MAQAELSAGTPNYVLKDGPHYIGPEGLPSAAGTGCSLLYGFSSKGLYDRFCSNSELALKPYPLVKGYLQSQIDTPGDQLKLVVIDAVGPHDPCLQAATMESVLEAQKNRAARLNTGYRLRLDQEADAYRVEEPLE